jgi:FPC/CPF motif-containing protein YcgG
MLSPSKDSCDDAPDSRAVEEQFAAFIADPAFPCLGARAAFNSGSYQTKVYDELTHPACSEQLAQDLQRFQHSEMRRTKDFATFVAIFRNPRDTNESDFEELFWSQLQQLHRIDAKSYEWDPTVSPDPNDAHFSFSLAGQALYVVGMHANSSRLSRRFPWPALVFNPHEQFERLREQGKWPQMQTTIRKRDIALQGSANPMLNEFGETSEARQYSGRAVDEQWRPPFCQEDSAAQKVSSAGRCPFAH